MIRKFRDESLSEKWWCENCQQMHDADVDSLHRGTSIVCEESCICSSCQHDDLLISGHDNGQITAECGLCGEVAELNEGEREYSREELRLAHFDAIRDYLKDEY